MVPWWWALIAAWCLPGVYCAVALLLQKPIRGLDEDGNIPKPVSVWRKIALFPLLLAILIVILPFVWWLEYWHSRQPESPRRSRRLIDEHAWGPGISDEPSEA